MTVCVTAADVLAVKLLSPLYFAVMEWEPNDKLDSESCAILLETVAVPKDVAPSRNVTVPVTVPPADGTTTAVNTTVWPKLDGLMFGETVVVVVDWLIVSVTGAEVLPANFVSPLYCAVSVCDPKDRVTPESCAMLFETFTVPSVVDPSKNVTVPVAEPLPGGWTVATSVSVWPYDAGFTDEDK